MTPPTDDVTAEIHGLSEPGAEGRPHVPPLIAVWYGEAIWFSTGPDERKAANLAENPACILTTGRGDLAHGALDIVLAGVAEQITTDRDLQPVVRAFAAKSGTQVWDFVIRDGAFADRRSGIRAIVFSVRPSRGLGIRKGDVLRQTTWRFPD
jgi:Pyridoxamine 5'-phosphate oxidase